MKNIVYLSTLDGNKMTGVSKKILQQIKAFRKLGFSVSYFQVKNKKCFYISEDKVEELGSLSSNKILYNLQYLKLARRKIKELNNIDVLYIRKIFSNPYFIKLLKTAKEKKITIFEELPTYPYDKECEKSSSRAIRLTIKVDKIFRGQEKKYISRYVTYSNDKEIFEIETINIINGIDIDEIKPIHFQTTSTQINIICVAAMEFWQGYDRIIKSLSKYYDNPDNKNGIEIILHMVGDGNKLGEWKKLSQNLGIAEFVKFYGFKQGGELDEIYDKCQIGCAGLGLFRKNINVGCTLKIKEFIAKGLPFVYATEEMFLEEYKFCLKVADDESIMEMDDIVDFYQSVKSQYSLGYMREFAKKNYDWTEIMKAVTKLMK